MYCTFDQWTHERPFCLHELLWTVICPIALTTWLRVPSDASRSRRFRIETINHSSNKHGRSPFRALDANNRFSNPRTYSRTTATQQGRRARTAREAAKTFEVCMAQPLTPTPAVASVNPATPRMSTSRLRKQANSRKTNLVGKGVTFAVPESHTPRLQDLVRHETPVYAGDTYSDSNPMIDHEMLPYSDDSDGRENDHAREAEKRSDPQPSRDSTISSTHNLSNATLVAEKHQRQANMTFADHGTTFPTPKLESPPLSQSSATAPYVVSTCTSETRSIGLHNLVIPGSATFT